MKTEILTKDGLNIYDELIKNYIKDSDIAASTSPDLINSCNGMLHINDIYGNTDQGTTSGKNLLDCSGLVETVDNGITFTPVYDDKGLLQYINANGTPTANAVFHLNYNVRLDTSKSYIFSDGQNSNVNTYYIQLYNGDATNLPTTFGGEFVPEDITYTSRMIVKTAVNNLKFYPMIRLATITDDTYEPFTNGASPNPSYPQEIKSVVLRKIKTCRKNLIDINNPTYNATITSGVVTETSYSRFYVIRAKKNERYTISKSVINGETVFYGFYNKIPKIGDTLNDRGVLTNLSTKTITASDNYLCVMFNNSEYMADDIQVELGTTSTEYEPYTESVVTLSEPITLNGIGGVRDNLDSKKFKTVVFDGSDDEAWRRSTVYDTRYYVHFSDSKWSSLVLCTQGIRRDSTMSGSIRVDSNLNFSIDTEFATVADWKAHLASKPMEVTYELAEPIETPLSDADVEALKSLKTYDGVTHIFTDSEVEPTLEVEYATSNVGVYLLELYNKSSSSSSGGDAEIKLSESTTYEPLE